MFGWGLIVFSSFIGWGTVPATLLRLKTSNDWGLQAGIGMAFLLFVGGLLSLASVVSSALMIGLTLIGALLWVFDLYRRTIRISIPSRFQILLYLFVGAVVILRYASVVHYQAYSCPDDNIAYFPFIARLLETGTLLDPFSMRRLAAYGGQTFLQAFIGAVGSEENAFLMDRGIAVIISYGLVLGFFRDRTTYGIMPYAIALLVIIVLPFPLLNSASHITGLVMFLTLFRTLELIPASAQTETRSIWVIALIIAAAASLRAHFLAAAALSVIFYWFNAALAHRQSWYKAITALAHTGSASVLCLLPWMVLQQYSSGSFLYPVFRGNHRADFENYSAVLSIGEHLQFFTNTVTDPKLLLFILPVVLLAVRRSYSAVLALYVGSLLTTAALIWVFTLSDVENIHRYVAPFLTAAFIATLVSFVRDAREPSASADTGFSSLPVGDKIIGAAMICLLPLMMTKDVERLTDRWGKVGLSPADRLHYRQMQAAIPTGASVMTVVNHPYALDYHRNIISAIDIPGAASPDPGVPYFHGPIAFKRYFLNQGIAYLAYENFDQPGACLYGRQRWQFYLSGDVPVWKMGAKYYLDLMQTLEKLAETENVVFKDHDFTVVQLRPR